MQDKINNILANYDAVSLNEAKKVSLMRRKDWKYIFNIKELPTILEDLKKHYKILEIDRERALEYQNTYFDTRDFDFYFQHHNSKLNRFKVRKREYLISDTSFIEIKYKNNKFITEKQRQELYEGRLSNDTNSYQFLESKTNLSAKQLEKKLNTSFRRITLINFKYNERITFDIYLKLSFNGSAVNMDNLVIAELKQDVYTKSYSPAKVIMKKNGIIPYRISKYCIGIALLNKDIKRNKFKKKLLRINKICDGKLVVK